MTSGNQITNATSGAYVALAPAESQPQNTVQAQAPSTEKTRTGLAEAKNRVFVKGNEVIVMGWENEKNDIKVNSNPKDGSINVNINGNEYNLTGDSAADKTVVVYGGNSADNIDLRGTGRRAKIYGSNGGDTIYGSDGDDEIHGGRGEDKIHGGKGEDVIYGDDGNDKLYGDEDSDTIHGGPGDDYAHGGDGNDTFYGGKGFDVFTGGKGVDKFLDYYEEEDIHHF